MKINRQKLDIALARKCMALTDLRKQFASGTLANVSAGKEVTPKTAGKLAAALGVDVEEIIAKED